MKAPDFAYVCPTLIEEALDLLGAYGESARLLAGGQSLVTSLNMRLSAPAILIDLNCIAGLSGIEERDGIVRVGAMTRHAELGTSPIVAKKLPLVAAASPYIAHPAIRNRGTIGGSVALADPAAELPACCLALGATMVIRSREDERRVAAGGFFQGLFATAIGESEILTAIEFPSPEPDAVFGFDELARRHGDYAMVGVAGAARRTEGGLGEARFVFFGVGDQPMLASAAGVALACGDIAGAQAALEQDLDPPDDVGTTASTKRHLARVLLGRVAGRMLAEPG